MAKTRWNDFNSNPPKKSGFYYCIVSGADHKGKKPYHKVLFYDDVTKEWCDHERMIMFEQYEIYQKTEGPNETEALEQVFKDKLCIRRDVLYWKNQSHIPGQ